MKTVLRILLVEDDKYFLLHLKDILKPFGLIEAASSWPEAETLLKSESYDLIVTDLNLPDGPDGLRVLEFAKNKKVMRLALTSSEDETLISKAYLNGAQHVLVKSKAKDHLPAFIKSLMAQRNESEIERLISLRFPTQNKTLIANIRKLIVSPWQGRSLLITGPTGTGKSVIGKFLAEQITSQNAPFIHLNCSEIPDNLLESELFGHEKGAFTGADQKKIGKLKAADGGVLFLDEVGTMSPAMQQKLLKAIEEKTFYPVGSTEAEKSSFTLITATCEDLHLKIREGIFREDLYFRISGLTLHLSPLSERREDIDAFVRLFQQQSPRRFILSSEAMKKLINHSWNGNLRELKQTIMSLADSGGGLVDEQHVESALGLKEKSHSTGLINEEIKKFIETNGLRQYFQLIEKEVTKDALKKHDGKITSCIKELKISSSAFYRILQEHQITQ
ncbi:MAG: sigma 54-interacting transcriptional regulator [Bacteriovoracaceae bacterium]|nr:sigma 54-interacting transcriptional regulator [Bacteriovoracaceae bacterium]